MAASATAIHYRGISVTTRGVRCHGNTFVADDSCGGAKNWWKGNVRGDRGGEGRERKSISSEGRRLTPERNYEYLAFSYLFAEMHTT
jgi:hypothetical protein